MCSDRNLAKDDAGWTVPECCCYQLTCCDRCLSWYRLQVSQRTALGWAMRNSADPSNNSEAFGWREVIKDASRNFVFPAPGPPVVEQARWAHKKKEASGAEKTED